MNNPHLFHIYQLYRRDNAVTLQFFVGFPLVISIRRVTRKHCTKRGTGMMARQGWVTWQGLIRRIRLPVDFPHIPPSPIPELPPPPPPDPFRQWNPPDSRHKIFEWALNVQREDPFQLVGELETILMGCGGVEIRDKDEYDWRIILNLDDFLRGQFSRVKLEWKQVHLVKQYTNCCWYL